MTAPVDTTFVSGTTITSDWLNGVNDFVIDPNASKIPYTPAGIGAVDTDVQSKLRESVSVKDFGAVGDGITDDTSAFNAAFLAGHTVELGGLDSTYLIAGYVGLPDQSLSAETPYRLIGNGATIKVTAAAAPFTSASWAANQTLTGNPFAGKLFVTGVNFIGDAPDGVFDCDHIYNIQVSDCSFANMKRVFISRHAKTGHADGYIQSLFITNNSFTYISEGIVVAKKAYNVVFSENQCEQCTYGLIIDGANTDYAIHNIRICDNLFEGGGVFGRLTHTLAGVITGNYMELNTLGDIGTRKSHFDLTYDHVGAGTNLPSWYIVGNSSQDSADQRNDAEFGLFKISGGYDQVTAHGNWADSAVTVSPVKIAEGNYSRRLQKYNLTSSPQKAGIDSRGSVLPRPLSYSLVSGTILQFASLTMPDAIAVPYRGGALNMSVVLKSMTADGKIWGECAFDCKLFMSPYGSGVTAAGQPTYWDVKGVISNYLEQSPTLVDSAAGASTVNVFTATPVFSFSRSGSVINIRASNFNAATIPTYGAIFKVLACITVSGNGLSDQAGSAFNWISFSN